MASAPVFWTTKDKNIITAFSVTYWHIPYTIYEFDASTLVTVGAPFEGHTQTISGLALSLDCTLLASTSYDKTIKLWAFESRQLLASFDIRSTACHLILSPDSRQLVYITMRKNICLCNIPPEILASIQPVPQVRIGHGVPRNPPLADSGALSSTPNRSTSEAPPNAQQSHPSHSLQFTPISFARRRVGSKSWTDRQPGTSRMQPTEPRFQPLRLRKDPLSSDGGPMIDVPSTTISPVMNHLPLPRIPSSTVASWPPQLRSDSHDLLPSSSHTDTVLPVRNDRPDNLPETMLQNLSKYITKDGDYPVARGGFGEIWKCSFHINRGSVKVCHGKSIAGVCC
ncbi:hypothetical protein F4604DRAFT_1294428 [Suillus subluteus]|nr:hypothetical protein F4604DRAFT_1294428 [Suillus subluteus]